MKILYIGTGAQAIGYNSETAVELIINILGTEMEKLGEDVGIIDIKDDTMNRNNKLKYHFIDMPGFLEKTKPKPGSFFHVLKKLIFSIKSVLLIYNLNKKEKIDIIHIQNQYPGFFIMLFLKRFMKKSRFVYTSHTPFWSFDKKDFKKYYFKTYLDRICMKLADKAIAIGYSQKNGLVKHGKIDKNKIIVIQNGVNLDKFYPGKSRMKKEEKLVVLSVARISNVKNQLMIIKTVPEIIKKRNIKFVFIGQLEEEDYVIKLKDFIKENKIEKYVEILGVKNEDLAEYYRLADIFVSASNAEGFPLTVLEAMASGCVLILSDIEPHKEILEDKGIVFFKKDNEKDFIEKLSKIIKDKSLREKLGKKSLESARKNYSWKGVALENKKLYVE